MAERNGIPSSVLDRRSSLTLSVAVIAFALAIVGALRYSGLIHSIGEWQFLHLGFYMPMITVLFWVGLATLVVWLIFQIRKRMQKNTVAPPDLTVERNRWIRNSLISVAILSSLVTLSALLNLLMLPRASGKDHVISTAALGAGYEGRARLDGFAPVGPIAYYSEGILFWRKGMYLVPLSGRPAGSPGAIRILAEVSPDEASNRLPLVYSGILRRDAAPKELYPLFASQNVTIAENAAVLYRNPLSMSFASWVLLVESIVVGVIALLASLFFRKKKEDQEIAET